MMTSVISGFQWDTGNWPKCASHGVSKAEIEETLLGQPAIQKARSGTDPERFLAIGKTRLGRHVFVVFAVRGEEMHRLLRPISARFMHAEEIEHFEKSSNP
jgi:uncharacterized protein